MNMPSSLCYAGRLYKDNAPLSLKFERALSVLPRHPRSEAQPHCNQNPDAHFFVYNVIQRSNGIAPNDRAMPLRREIPDMEQVIDHPFVQSGSREAGGGLSEYTGINKRCIKP